ncbi:MAG: c-type cytochrome [Chloroflexi bacterium]|nr:c-type cytochrome [Chloroflexota bacterium]
MTRLSLALALTAFLSACTLADTPIPAGPIQTGPIELPMSAPASLPSTTNGQAIYEQNCQSCHGPVGMGLGEVAEELESQGAVLPNLADPEMVYASSPQHWYGIITNGNIEGLMPPWEDALTAQERWDVTFYLYRFSLRDDQLSLGEEVYQDLFVEAFGPDAQRSELADPAVFANLSRQNLANRLSEVAPVDLTDEELQAVATYLQTLLVPDMANIEVAPDDGAGSPESASQGPEQSEAQAPGIVQGQVINRSIGGDLPTDQQIQLIGVELGGGNRVNEFLNRSTTLDDEGRFRFDDVPVDGVETAYIVRLIYEGVEFSTGASFEGEQTTLEIPLTIYDAIFDPFVITVDAMNLVVRRGPEALQVVQVARYSNSSDRVFVTEAPIVGGRRGSVRVNVPSSAFSLSFGDGQIGGRYVVFNDQLYDTRQVLPGADAHSVANSYFLPFDNSHDLLLPIAYQTQQVNLFVEEGLVIRSDQLREAGVEIIDGQAYTTYVGTDFAPGQALTGQIQVQGAGNLTLLLTAGVLLVVVVLVGSSFAGIRRTVQTRQQQPPAIDQLSTPVQAMLRQIAALDDAYTGGKLNRYEYEEKRSALKADLAKRLLNRKASSKD